MRNRRKWERPYRRPIARCSSLHIGKLTRLAGVIKIVERGNSSTRQTVPAQKACRCQRRPRGSFQRSPVDQMVTCLSFLAQDRLSVINSRMRREPGRRLRRFAGRHASQIRPVFALQGAWSAAMPGRLSSVGVFIGCREEDVRHCHQRKPDYGEEGHCPDEHADKLHVPSASQKANDQRWT
jgi:hypothetical protein